MDNTRLASSVFKRLFFLMEEPLVPFAFYDKAVQAGTCSTALRSRRPCRCRTGRC